VREGLSRPLWLALVIAAFCVPLFIGLGRTDLENDEGIYSYAVDGILRTGDWLNPPLSPASETFLEKPPLKFWLVAAPIALGILPHNELGLRFWDAVFGSLAFLYVYAFGRRLSGPICGVVAVLMLFVYRPLLFDHGIRGNNMEAPLVLCYCGGMYHYLVWASSEGASRRRHLWAVWAYFFLGFMTKFVAAFFLPIVLVGMTLLDGAARRRLREDLPTWALGGVAFLALAAPWFVYEHLREGTGFWRVLVGEHVYQRFTTGLDVGHIKPWYFYFVTIFAELEHTGTHWLAIAGAVLLLVRAVRDPNRETLLVLAWFGIPLGLMSMGTSKLHHYVYPFVPPVALAAGYAAGWLVQVGRRYLDAAMETVQRWMSGMRSSSRGVRGLLLTVSAIAFVVGVITLIFGPIDWRVGKVHVFRNSHVSRPLVISLVCATLAGRGVFAARVLWPVTLLLSILPINSYEDSFRDTSVERHPLRSARDCLVRVRAQELEAQRPAPGIYAIGEEKWFLHSYFYYLHHVGGWQRSQTLDEQATANALFVPGEQRPVLMNEANYRLLKSRYDDSVQAVPMLALSHVLLLMPGPYSACGPRPTPPRSQ
jgi:4-amino-4-deoxy-L-arabinose transferase-like glycosyltransferase